MSFCCTVWGLHPSGSTDRLFKFQKRAARIIFDKPFDYPHEELFAKLKWLDFNSLVKYRTVLQTFKSLNELAPNYLKELFSFMLPTDHNFRSKRQQFLAIPSHRTVMLEHSYSVQGAKLYNKVTSNTCKTDKFSKFKSDAFKYFFNESFSKSS